MKCCREPIANETLERAAPYLGRTAPTTTVQTAPGTRFVIALARATPPGPPLLVRTAAVMDSQGFSGTSVPSLPQAMTAMASLGCWSS